MRTSSPRRSSFSAVARDMIAKPSPVATRPFTFHVLEGDDARQRQRDATVRAVEQVRVEVILELADLKGDGGLGHAQRVGRLRERSVLGNGVKRLESTIRHIEIVLCAGIILATARRSVRTRRRRLCFAACPHGTGAYVQRMSV